MPDLNINELALWPHQRSAVETSDRYFAAMSARSGLVHMPTGTGKTGIMATISTRRAQVQPVLVVCPSIALVHQLMADFNQLFWQKIRADRKWAPELTLHLLPSKMEEVVAAINNAGPQRVVVFSTIQTLERIHSGPNYARLRGLFGTVLFDEGHREPAPLWAQAARGLGAPTILFSATPFRNDLKVFDVDMDYVHFLSFKEAVESHLIRGIEISEQILDDGALGFARAAVAVRDNLVHQGRFEPRHKMIIRADNEDDVEALFAAFSNVLEGRPEGILALHDNFALDGPIGRQRRQDVPRDLRTRTENFLIHQLMLAEGIDDPACTMLALYEPFSTERQLVQQIGRLTRHEGRVGTPIANAFVLARAGDGVGRMWGRFLAFDDACVRNDGKPPVRNDAGVFENLIRALPEVDYISGKFRARLNIDDIDFDKDLRVPKSAVVFELTPAFEIDAFQEEIAQGLDEEDRFERKIGIVADGSCRFHITLRLRQTPFLADALFLLPSLEVTIYAKQGNRLFVYDSAGLWVDNSNARDRLKAGSLRALLPDHPDTRVTFLSMKNTDLGPIALKSRSMGARSLSVSGVFMGEHLHVVTRATGRIGKNRRAIAFVRSRVRDGDGANWTPSEFFEWTRDVAVELDSDASGSGIFQRFALPTAVPTNTDPRNILVDIEELVDEFVDDEDDKVDFDVENVCVDVAEDLAGPGGFRHRFEFIINRQPISIWIKWDRKRRKYWLRSDALSRIKLRENPRISLTRRLNQRQPFRIVPAEAARVYAYGGFYAVDLDLRRQGGAGALVLNLIQNISGLGSVTSEKGDLAVPADTWPKGSLFYFIDAALKPNSRSKLFGEPFPTLVCDDLGDEVADFIGVDEGTGGSPARAVFIAAKWKRGNPGVSASSIYDVCAQAAKNLAYLKSDARDLPGNGRKWDREWTLEGGRVARIRTGPGAAAIRSSLGRTRSNPNAQRAVWMVLGGGILSRSALTRELARQIPEPHVLQFIHLVLSVHAACQSVGAELRIFCAD